MNTKLEAIKNYLSVVASKTSPARPIKGNPPSRVRQSRIPFWRTIKPLIPPQHRATVGIYRGAGFGGPVDFCSPEVATEILFLAA